DQRVGALFCLCVACRLVHLILLWGARRPLSLFIFRKAGPPQASGCNSYLYRLQYSTVCAGLSSFFAIFIPQASAPALCAKSAKGLALLPQAGRYTVCRAFPLSPC